MCTGASARFVLGETANTDPNRDLLCTTMGIVAGVWALVVFLAMERTKKSTIEHSKRIAIKFLNKIVVNANPFDFQHNGIRRQ